MENRTYTVTYTKTIVRTIQVDAPNQDIARIIAQNLHEREIYDKEFDEVWQQDKVFIGDI
jgi:hypothetical protein